MSHSTARSLSVLFYLPSNVRISSCKFCITIFLLSCSLAIVVEKDWRFLVREISVVRISENCVMVN